MKIKYLDWDSSFFNKKIGLLDQTSNRTIFKNQNDYELIYVVSDKDIIVDIEDFKQTYAENKVIFSKRLDQIDGVRNSNVFEVSVDFPRNQIYELAFESGKFSRFKLDPNFSQNEFEKLYIKWVDNSFNKEFADAVFVYKEQGKILGFVTYKVCGKYATVGLLGVCSKHQGKGIGKKLIQSVEMELANKGIEELRIPTQLQNELACKFYKGLSYNIIENKMIKHFWKYDPLQ
jgi:dTDP-4-amino-4,6-dideoxy-D-galactose acyltransferase